jgi:two-component sensor histidine kinase
VQAVAFHTAREEDPARFVDTFGKRIAGLAASYDLLTASMWEGVGIADLVHLQLAHFENLIGSRIKLEGPPIKLKPPAAQAIGMALHELATNAGKYGALSSDEGSVRIAWGSSPAFRISWIEIGGPAVTPPSKRGFGHRVMVELTEQQLDATVRLEYPSLGLVWEVVAPIECTLQDGHRVAA